VALVQGRASSWANRVSWLSLMAVNTYAAPLSSTRYRAVSRWACRASYADYRIMPSVTVKVLVNGVTTAEWSA